MTTAELIDQIKQVFAVHDIRVTLISDNGPDYASEEFSLFPKAWHFHHLTSSPHHPKANGKAESEVKIMKSIIKKANKQGEDMWKVILEWRNSSTPSQDSSPVQTSHGLMSRRTRSFLPCKESLYKPEVQSMVAAQVVKKRKLAKRCRDVNAKPLPNLVIGQPVRVKVQPLLPYSDWKSGVALKRVAPRGYLV